MKVKNRYFKIYDLNRNMLVALSDGLTEESGTQRLEFNFKQELGIYVEIENERLSIHPNKTYQVSIFSFEIIMFSLCLPFIREKNELFR